SLAACAGGNRRRDSDRLRAERVYSHRQGRPDHAGHEPGRNGTGHLHLDVHGRTGGGTGPDPPRARTAQRQAVRKLDPRRTGNRGKQAGGGSPGVGAFYEPLRRAGATARTMLVVAAGETWSVDTASCRARGGVVTHTPTRRELSYGALAEKAAALPVPAQVA